MNVFFIPVKSDGLLGESKNYRLHPEHTASSRFATETIIRGPYDSSLEAKKEILRLFPNAGYLKFLIFSGELADIESLKNELKNR